MGEKCSKCCVVFFNLLFWISGCAAVGAGVWLLYDRSYAQYWTLFTVNQLPQEIVQYAAFGVIGFGGLILFVGFFGCCGAIQNSKCMLGTYVFFLVLICIVELAAGLITLWFRFYLPPDIRSSLKMKVEKEYSLMGQEVFTTAIDFTQYQLGCCAIDGHEDYVRSKFTNKSLGEVPSLRVPLTCCVINKEDIWEDEPWVNPKPENQRSCTSPDPGNFNGFLNERGCWQPLYHWYMLHNTIALGALGVLVLIEIFAILTSICLFRNIEDDV